MEAWSRPESVAASSGRSLAFDISCVASPGPPGDPHRVSYLLFNIIYAPAVKCNSVAGSVRYNWIYFHQMFLAVGSDILTRIIYAGLSLACNSIYISANAPRFVSKKTRREVNRALDGVRR
jgi:hypothetical protein